METPSSTRRITRSQALATSNNNIPTSSKKIEDSEKGPVSKSRNGTGSQQDRSALIDITNDSPIIGLAMGKFKTPSSSSTLSKKRVNNDHQQAKTPGSGEALLRGQVKTLLQRVEEEAEILKLSSENRPSLLHLLSPAGLLAPANTPQVTASEVQEQIMISEMITQIFDGKNEGPESEKSLITRSLLLDFSEKSESSDSCGCSSVLTHEGGIGGESTESKEKSSAMEDDDDSVWSIQVNASTKDDEEEEEDEEENDEDDYDYGEEAKEEDHDDEYDEGLVDELCEGMSKISVNGRHTRFVYNSDDEIEGEEDCDISSPGVLKLKGMPTPKGKHLRFPEESEEEEEVDG